MQYAEYLSLMVGVFFVAGAMKGIVGIGFPMIVIAILAQFIDPRIAFALLCFPVLFSNVWQIMFSGMVRHVIKEYWRLYLPLCLGLWGISRFAISISSDTLLLIVGSVIILFVLINTFSKPVVIPSRYDGLCQAMTGVVASIMGGFTALFGPPMIMYLLSRKVNKEEFIGTICFLFFIGTLPLTLSYWQTGIMTPDVARYSMMMVVPTLIGLRIGEFCRSYVKEGHFTHAAMFVFLLLGLNLIRNALF